MKSAIQACGFCFHLELIAEEVEGEEERGVEGGDTEAVFGGFLDAGSDGVGQKFYEFVGLIGDDGDGVARYLNGNFSLFHFVTFIFDIIFQYNYNIFRALSKAVGEKFKGKFNFGAIILRYRAKIVKISLRKQ